MSHSLKDEIEALVAKATPGPLRVGYRAIDITAADGAMKVFDVRGWGYLTGKGALGLDPDVAKAIQRANAVGLAALRLVVRSVAAVRSGSAAQVAALAPSTAGILRCAQCATETVSSPSHPHPSKPERPNYDRR